MTKKVLLKNPPTVVKKLSDGAEYIPIGHIEQELDALFPDWSTGDFKFQIVKVGNYWLADASCILYIGNRRMQGAVTFQISSKDNNIDFSATALSFCISNAAKRLGIHFGRALNGRLEAGETSIPIVQVKEPMELDEKTDIEWQGVKKKLLSYEWRESAQEYINSTDYKMTIEAKQIINSKPIKAEAVKELLDKCKI